MTVVADDTEVLVMLVHMWDQNMGDLFLRHKARKSFKKDLKIISIKNVVSNLLIHVKENLLFIYCMGWLRYYFSIVWSRKGSCPEVCGI